MNYSHTVAGPFAANAAIRFAATAMNQADDIVTIDDGALQPAPAAGGATTHFLEGITSVEDRMVMVLALDHLSLEPGGADLAAAA